MTSRSTNTRIGSVANSSRSSRKGAPWLASDLRRRISLGRVACHFRKVRPNSSGRAFRGALSQVSQSAAYVGENPSTAARTSLGVISLSTSTGIRVPPLFGFYAAAQCTVGLHCSHQLASPKTGRVLASRVRPRQAGLRQGVAHVAGEAVDEVVLAAVGLVGDDDYVAPVREHGVAVAHLGGHELLDPGDCLSWDLGAEPGKRQRRRRGHHAFDWRLATYPSQL